MAQTAYFDLNGFAVSMELPDPETEVVDGVTWGRVENFPTPAYWVYQTLAKRFEAKQLQYKLGRTFLEEVGACLLGGHGIPAHVGLAAYEHMRKKGAFDGQPHSSETLNEWLSEPIRLSERSIKYRFAKQKSAYLSSAITKISEGYWRGLSGRALRDWLVEIPGIGLKTASWIVRNWQDSDDVAIIDIHLFRAGVIAGLFEPDLNVQKDYHHMEERYLAFSLALNMRPSELDAVIWYEMSRAQDFVIDLMRETNLLPPHEGSSRSRTNKARANSSQAALAI